MKNRSSSYLALLAVFAAAITTSVARAQDVPVDQDWERYQHILRASTLEWLFSEPFVLKVDYELYDLDGKLVEKGTAEESWTQEEVKTIRIQSPSLSEGSAPPSDEYKTHTRESYLVHQALDDIARPFPSAIHDKDFAMEAFHEEVNGAQLSCFALAPGGNRTASTPTYCTDVDNRVIAMTGPQFVVERTDFRKSREHEVPMDVSVSYEGKKALIAHVTELDALPFHPAAGSGTKVYSDPARIPGGVIAGRILKKKNPDYPKQARKQHLSGTVILIAIITKQGTITALDVLASPDPLFSKSAQDAVKTWTYQPYLLKGEPTEVDTTILVNYNLGR